MKYLRFECDWERDTEFHIGAQLYIHRHFLYSNSKQQFLINQFTPYHVHLEIGFGIVYAKISIGKEYEI
jgi:hypothetical protein